MGQINEKWINDFGLLNAKEADINAENAPLWSMEHFFLTSEDTYYTPLVEYTNKCKVSNGLYNQLTNI